MMKLKKIGAIILAVFMVTVCMNAWAAESLTGGKVGNDNPASALQNSMTFNKEIILFNTTSAEVHHPAITYEYTIANQTVSNVTVTDATPDTGNVYGGIGAGTNVTITSSVTFASADAQTGVTPNGAVISKPITVTVADPDGFGHAGIFRYLITETNNSAARTAAGVARSADYVTTRYLDIYVRRAVAADGVSTDLVVYGYVLFEGENTSITSGETEVSKSQGFVATETSTGVYGTTDVDYYETYNLKVEKDIVGALAETDHEFPFSVAFTSPITTTAVIEWAKGTATTSEASLEVAEGATNATLTLGNATTTGYGDSAIKLADAGYVTFYGLPAGTTAVVSEINDTYDIYKASQDSSSAGGTWTAPDAANIAANHVDASIYTASGVNNGTMTTTNSETDTYLKVKNEIEIISPTGYVARFAPYALILIGGIALLIIAKKHKKHTEEE